MVGSEGHTIRGVIARPETAPTSLRWRLQAALPPLWASGPEVDTEGPVVVSLTDSSVDRWRDLLTWARAGISLARGWYAMPGAVGLWQWSVPLERRSGSIS